MKKVKIISLQIIIIPVIFIGCTQKVSVTPPDVPPPDGFIFIDSNPPGADIYINDKFVRRRTPDSVKYLATDSYKITLKKENFRDTSFTEQITEGKRPSIFVDYTKDPLMYGKIKCVSTPDNASIFLNGSTSGKKTPAVLDNLWPGDYFVKYQLKNHLDDSVKVTVQSNSTVTAEAKTLIDTTVWSFYNTTNSQIPSTSLTGLVVDPSNNVWIGTEDIGLLKFDGNIWQEYSFGNSLLPSNNVTAIAVNQDGTVWAGTHIGLLLTGNGLMEKFNSRFSAPLIETDIKFIFTNAYNPITADNTYFVTDTTIVSTRISTTRVWSASNTVLKELGLNGLKFSSICVDNSYDYWIGTEQNGIIDINTGERFNTSNSSQIGDNINTFAMSPTGVMWIGYGYTNVTHSSVSYYSNGNLVAPQIVPANSNTNTIFIDKNDVKWIGTTKGLVEYNQATGRRVYNSDNTGLNIDDIRGVGEDSFGRVWIAAYGGGIFVKKK